jgi:phosphoribosylaminoimidazolecarboxamide formyltransferase/IMP cyclohydrolase
MLNTAKHRALLSVSDKRDLVPFARALEALGFELVSTGGTAKGLAEAGLRVTPIDQVTGFPEMLDGRVKTLHPKVHGGLLGRVNHPEHLQAMNAHGIVPIDLLCVNLYPFAATIAKPGASFEECIEQIDIGGPAMIRSAAKNHESVAVVTDPSQYDRVIEALRRGEGRTDEALRRELAAEAFAHTARYDATIAAWMQGPGELFPETLELRFTRVSSLRYGENPHQRAAVYRDAATADPGVVDARVVEGKPLSYNNILDAGAALELVTDLRTLPGAAAAACVIKHTNPCGAAIGADVAEAFDRAYAGDPLAAYGGIVAIAGRVDAAIADRIAKPDRFLEVVVADAFDDAAIATLANRWKNVRLIATGARSTAASSAHRLLRSVPGGLLVQEADELPVDGNAFQHSAGPAPTDAMRHDAAFLAVVSKHLKSNAVCIGGGGSLWGAGAGQMDRVAACRHAVEKASARLKAAGKIVPVAASDAFFPFDDGPRALIDAGVGCLVHPGGSKRDADTEALCRERGATLLISGVRHFRH